VKSSKRIFLDFEIDKLTNSIENTVTGEVFDTIITPVSMADSTQIKKNDWAFNWKDELKNKEKEVYKLTTENNPTVIQGSVSITDKHDHIFMDLIESAKFNKGKNKLYHGVAGNLVAFSCKTAFERHYDGYVSFVAKTQLIEHYQKTLGAILFSGNRMYIDTKEALILVSKYFKNFDHGEF